MRLAVFLGTLALIGLVTLFAPVEKDLGANARLVYFHGAWVWSGLGCFFLSGAAGLVGLLTRRLAAHTWSKILGWTAMIFWLTYLPVSLLVMKLNWGGLFLDEPRWRVPMAFAIVGVLLQAGLALLSQPALTSLANAGFAAALGVSLGSLTNVLHPDSPILSATSQSIQIFFISLLVLSIAAGVQMAALIARRLHGQ
jgi:hypothetical protein